MFQVVLYEREHDGKSNRKESEWRTAITECDTLQ
jgi:hypothetical protein